MGPAIILQRLENSESLAEAKRYRTLGSTTRNVLQFGVKSLYQPVNRTRIIQKTSNTSEVN
jgi:hypothetical protein